MSAQQTVLHRGQGQTRNASAPRTPLLRLAKKPLVRRKAVGTPVQTEEQQHQGEASLCSHPDAIRRRLEQLEWQRQRDAEQARLSQLGSKWHEAPSSMVTCSSPEEYRQLLARAAQENRLLVAKFFTEECYVCKSLYPKMRKIAADHSDVLWAKLNGSDPNLVSLFQSLGISKVPLFHMVRDGQLVAELSASLSPDKLAAFRTELMAHKPPRTSTSSPGHLGVSSAAQEDGKGAGEEQQQQQQQQLQQQQEQEMMALHAVAAPQVA